MREREIKFRLENITKVSAMFQFANAFVIRMIDATADASGMTETERTELFKIYLDGITAVDEAYQTDSKIST